MQTQDAHLDLTRCPGCEKRGFVPLRLLPHGAQ